ncbi:MAG: hypothetical protein MK110_00110 [Fuerstiella sp.]|nr:hypothetical protein [Fuerstiella sp.]
MRYFVSLLLIALLSGCQYNRSFLNMNSDSGVPFLGMQLSVDAGDTNRKHISRQLAVRPVSTDTTTSESTQKMASVLTQKTKTARAQSPDRFSPDSMKPLLTSGEYRNPLVTAESGENPLMATGRRLVSF